MEEVTFEMKNVEIPAHVFTELIRTRDRVRTIERLLNNGYFVTLAEVIAILGIEKEIENETL